MNRAETVRAIARSLQQDLEHYPQLFKLLQQQQQLMLARNSAALSELNQRLEQIYPPLKQRAAQRQQWLQALGLSGDPQGFEQLLQLLPPASREKLANSYQKLKQLMQDCQQQNEYNGKLLVKQQQLLNSLLNPQQTEQLDYGYKNHTP